MYVNLTRTCVICRKKFRLKSVKEHLFDYISGEQGRGVSNRHIENTLVLSGWERTQIRRVLRFLATEHCRKHRRNAASGQGSVALAVVTPPQQHNALGPVLPDSSELFGDVIQLMNEAAAPIERRRRTFWEWCQGLDLEAIQIENKLRAGNAADQLLTQRLEMSRKVQEIARIRF